MYDTTCTVCTEVCWVDTSLCEDTILRQRTGTTFASARNLLVVRNLVGNLSGT